LQIKQKELQLFADDLARQKKEAAEREQKREAIKQKELQLLADDLARQKKEAAEREQKREATKNNGLQVTANSEFSKIAKQVESYLRTLKISALPEADHENLLTALKEGFKLIGKSKTREIEWQKKLANSIYLAQWIGEDLAKEWATIILQIDVQ